MGEREGLYIHHTNTEDGDKGDFLSPGDVEGSEDWGGGGGRVRIDTSVMMFREALA